MNDKGQVGMASKPLPVLKPVKLAKAPKLPLKPVIALLNELSFMKPPPPKKKEIVDLPIAIKPAEIEIKVIKIEKPIPVDPVESADSVVETNSPRLSDEPRLTEKTEKPRPAVAPDSARVNTESSTESVIPIPVGSTNGTSSGYGSEGYVSEEEKKLKNQTATAEPPKITKLEVVDIRQESKELAHCARCHKSFDPNSPSNAEQRCLLPHPTKMVIPIRRDGDGTHFVCLCCRTEFKLPKMTFYEAGVNSMLTGYCFVGQHVVSDADIDYQCDGGAALSCEEAGCIEFFV